MKKLVSLLSLALLSGPAWAADIEQYVGLDYTWGNIDLTGAPTDYDVDGVRVRYGQYLLPHIAVEAHYILGTQDANFLPDTDVGGKVSLKHTASLFLRGDIGSTFKLYGLVGWSYSTIKFPGVQKEESDLSYGGGIEYAISKDTFLDLSYVIYHDEDYVEATGTSLGFTYHF